MDSFRGTFVEVLRYFADGVTFMAEFFNCLPEGVRELLFASFVIVFGFAVISAFLRILT